LHDLQARDAALEGVEQLAAGHEVGWHGGFSSRNKCKRALAAESPGCPSILIISHVSIVERSAVTLRRKVPENKANKVRK
jgi:hypothetical protein